MVSGKGILRKSVLALFLGELGLITGNIAESIFCQKIENQSELEQILLKEKKKLGLKDDIKIYARLSDDPRHDTGHAVKLGEKTYGIMLGPVFGHNVNVLRHELYHIADGHCDEEYSTLKYYFIEEQVAMIYSLTGIKL